MLTLSAKTKLTPLEALDRTYRYFTDTVGLRVVELVGHMHAHQGFTEIRVSSGTLSAKGQYDSRQVLQEILEHIEDRYGLRTAHYLLHMHSVPDESVGHLVAKVTVSSPTEVELTSEAYDEQVKEFVQRL
jgi:hypothetical protein